MIFAAGKGTRLQPITHSIPKGLVEVGGQSMLELVARKLAAAGVNELVINVHHHAEKMKDFISGMQLPGVRIHVSDESAELLDTGGGLLHVRKYLEGSDPFFIYNVDVLSDIDLKAMLQWHRSRKALVTLAVSTRKTARYLLVDDRQRLAGWQNVATGETIQALPFEGRELRQMAFSGIHLLEPAIFPLIQKKGCFAILPKYLELAASHPIFCMEHDASFYADIGTTQKLEAARILYAQQPRKFGPVK